jgi:hypothetical protein
MMSPVVLSSKLRKPRSPNSVPGSQLVAGSVGPAPPISTDPVVTIDWEPPEAAD